MMMPLDDKTSEENLVALLKRQSVCQLHKFWIVHIIDLGFG